MFRAFPFEGARSFQAFPFQGKRNHQAFPFEGKVGPQGSDEVLEIDFPKGKSHY